LFVSRKDGLRGTIASGKYDLPVDDAGVLSGVAEGQGLCRPDL
jgi:hypothetical protein